MQRRLLEFEVGNHVFLKVMPKREVVRFGKRGKLSPRFIGHFEILERIGTVAYRLASSPNMTGVHEVFHISILRIYILQIQLMWWIGGQLRLTRMGPLRRDQCALLIAVIRCCDARP